MRQSIIRDPGGDRVIRIIYDIAPASGSVIIVPAGTLAYVICNGVVGEPLGPGRHSLKTGLSPFFSRISNIMTNGEPALSVSIIFISPNVETFMTIGVGELYFKEKTFNLHMKAMSSVVVNYNISKPGLFLSKLVGMYQNQFTQEDIEPAFRCMVLPDIREALSRAVASEDIVTINNNLVQMSNNLYSTLIPTFDEYGIRLNSISVQGINIPPDQLDRLYQAETRKLNGTIDNAIEAENVNTVYDGIQNRILERALSSSTGNALTEMVMMGTMLNSMRGPMMDMFPNISTNLFGNSAAPDSASSNTSDSRRRTDSHRDDLDNTGPTIRRSNQLPVVNNKKTCRMCGSLIPAGGKCCPVCNSML